jgi:predicted ATPase with chaperone activity
MNKKLDNIWRAANDQRIEVETLAKVERVQKTIADLEKIGLRAKLGLTKSDKFDQDLDNEDNDEPPQKRVI